MDRNPFASYQAGLLEKERELARAVTRHEQEGQAEVTEPLDFGDKATITYSKESVFQQLESDRATLALVREALARGQNGHFGECVACGHWVEEKRLEAVPWTRYCLPCQQQHDKGLL